MNSMCQLVENLEGLSAFKREVLASLLDREGLDSANLQAVLQPGQNQLRPLSASQRRFWYLSQLAPPGSLQASSWVAYLSGHLDRNALEAGLNQLIERRDQLRSVFRLRRGRPMRVVLPAEPLPVPLVDLAALPTERLQEQAGKVAACATQAPFDLHRAPLLRGLLVRMGRQEHALVLSWHRMLVGECRETLLFRELCQLYEQGRQGRAVSVALQEPALEDRLDYWKKQLEGELPKLELPTDHPRPPCQGLRAGRNSFALPGRVISGLLAGQPQGDLRAVLAAAFKSLLFRYSSQEDLLVALWANQCPGLLFLRSDLGRDWALCDFAAHLSRRIQAGLAIGGVSQDRLAEELSLDEDYSRAPLAQALFSWRDPNCERWREGGLCWRVLEASPPAALRDLTLQAAITETGLKGVLLYDSDLFEPQTMERMAAHLRNLLHGIADDPGQPLSGLPLLSPQEMRQLLEDWDFTHLQDWKPTCVHLMVAKQASRQPDAIAISFQGRELSYAGLVSYARRISQRLAGEPKGVRQRVAILLENGPDVIAAMLGTAQAGQAFVTLDPRYPRARLGQILQEVKPTRLITHQAGGQQQQSLIRDYLGGRDCRMMLLGRRRSRQRRPHSAPSVAVRPDDPIYVAFTSGSTGRPKGILHTHRSFGAFLHWYRHCFELEKGQRIGQWASITFDPSFCEIFGALSGGATVCPSPSPIQADPAAVIEWLRRQCVTFLEVVPSFGRQLIQALKEVPKGSGRSPLPSLRQLSFVGEALPVGLVREWQALFSKQLQLANLYGPTEAVVATCHLLKEVTSNQRSIPVGKPIDGSQVLILDRRGRLCPIGIKGELYLRSQSLADGYFGRPQETARAFLENRFHDRPPQRIYRTGDLGRWLPNGEIEFFGRRDHQVKIRGVRVELEEVEATLLHHEAVRECALAAHDYAPGDKRLVGYVVRRQGWQEDQKSGPLTTLQSYHISQCRKLYDGLYGLDPTFSQRDRGLNRRVWTTGANQSFGEEEVLEVIEDSARHILSLRPRRILEVGSGTGLLLFRLAPHCDLYQATDISRTALDYLRERLQQHSQPLPGVKIERRAAHQLEGIAQGSFDAVVLSFVSMHFPDVDYLVRFLEDASRIVAPGGFLFIGGVRHLPLLEVFQTAVQLDRAAADLPLAHLRDRIRRRLASEKDLAVDPALFEAFVEQSPHLSRAVIQPIGGRRHNDITRYLYDVTLLAGRKEDPIASVRWNDWAKSGLTLQALPEALADLGPQPVGFSDLPNARLSGDLLASQLVHQGQSQLRTVGEVRQALSRARSQDAVDPADLRSTADQFGCLLKIDWGRSGANGCFDAVFGGRGNSEDQLEEPVLLCAPRQPVRPQPWASYVNNPLQASSAGRLAPQLRSYLKENLPEQFVPTAFVFLDALPRGPNGKVARQKLPRPDRLQRGFEDSYAPPRTPLQIRICEVWQDVLQAERLGIHDDFFELGGHSLLATQVVTQLRASFSVELPLQDFFRSPTIAGLSGCIEAEMDAGLGQQEGRLAKLVYQVRRLSEGEARTLVQQGLQTLPDWRER